MLSDSPSNYLREPEIDGVSGAGADASGMTRRRLMDKLHSTWQSRGGMVRDWYVGAMTNWTPRELEIDLSFLPEGNFHDGCLSRWRERESHGQRL